MTATGASGVYGTPSAELAEVPAGAIQFSPLVPGASALEHLSEGALASMTMLTPPGTLERHYAMALALRAVAPGGVLTVLAPKDRGGTRLRKEMQSFGCAVSETALRHHRIAICARPAALTGIDEVLSEGGAQLVAGLDLWSQPGVFSWDRIDPGTALLLQHLPALSGHGADFGCGIGILARALLASENIKKITLIDIDRRAIDAARRNIDDPRVNFSWADLRDPTPELAGLDFVVMNAPFHDGGSEDKMLALRFVKRAAEALRKGGTCWLVANRHLPYEAEMQPLFKRVDLKTQTGSYKIYEART
ncbi:MAG: class I SAM-dependent methyltransferase [Pseudolabrys sp.]